MADADQLVILSEIAPVRCFEPELELWSRNIDLPAVHDRFLMVGLGVYNRYGDVGVLDSHRDHTMLCHEGNRQRGNDRHECNRDEALIRPAGKLTIPSVATYSRGIAGTRDPVVALAIVG